MNQFIETIDLTGLEDDMDDQEDFPTVKLSTVMPAFKFVRDHNNNETKESTSGKESKESKKKQLSEISEVDRRLEENTKSGVLGNRSISKSVSNTPVVDCIEIIDNDDENDTAETENDSFPQRKRNSIHYNTSRGKIRLVRRKVSESQCSLEEKIQHRSSPCLSSNSLESHGRPKSNIQSNSTEIDSNWNEMFERLRAYHIKYKSWNVCRKNDQILHRWMWNQRQAYRFHLEKKGSDLNSEQMKLLNSINFDWGSSRAMSSSTINDYLWYEKYDQFLEFCKANGRSRAHKNEDGYFWQTTQRHQYWDRKQGKKSQLTDERIRLLEKAGFGWRLESTSETTIVDLTSMDNPESEKSTPQQKSTFNSRKKFGSRLFPTLSHSFESRFVFVNNTSKVSQQGISTRREKKMFNFMMSEEEAVLEQERLFEQARARTKNIKINIGLEPIKFHQQFSRPISDVKNLPKDHWTWPCMYARLGLPKDSSEVLVRKNFRKLALLYHPDKHRGNNNLLNQFLAVKEAFENITNNQR